MKKKLPLNRETLRNLQAINRSMRTIQKKNTPGIQGGITSSWVCSAIGGALVSKYVCEPIIESIDSLLASCNSCDNCSVSCPDPSIRDSYGENPPFQPRGFI